MKISNRTFSKALLIGALSFSYAANATDNTLTHTTVMPVQQGNQGVPAMEKELLGPYADINSIPAADLRQAYIMLLQSTRDKSSTWTDAEWNKAQAIAKKLDARKKIVEKDLTTDDTAKIKMLTGELRALETQKDIKD